MEKSKFKIGDTVKLKSNSPLMTVSELINTTGMQGDYFSGIVICKWFDEKKEINNAKFHQDELKINE